MSHDLQLEHLNLPARDPEGLARWYAERLGLQDDGHRVRGPGVLIVFQRGEPVGRASELHVGFRVPSRAALEQWAEKFSGQPTSGTEFVAFRTHDPEGNCIEFYCRVDS